MRGISDAMLDRVFAVLEAEADMDGLTTITQKDLALLTDISHVTANLAIRTLAADGRIEIQHIGGGIRRWDKDNDSGEWSPVYDYCEILVTGEKSSLDGTA